MIRRAAAILMGSLVAATSFAASNVIQYTYDAVGNITNITRQAAAGFAITGFSPASGPAGTPVTIYGTGFSATATNDIVKFNGVIATVNAASAGSISATVPVSATTGRITVTVGSQTATSAQDFIFISTSPTITSFTPTSGASGTAVSVVGTNFKTTGTAIKLNATAATSTVTDSTSLSFTVPANTASGRISATTSDGTGASSTDFLVAPPGILLTDVATTVHLTAGGGAQNVAVSTMNKHAIVMFDGVSGGFYTMQFGQIAVSPSSAALAYKVVKPDNTVLATGSIAGNNRTTIHIPQLPLDGTYSIVVSPGSATFNSNVRVAADPFVTPDGAAIATSLDTPSQSARFVVQASANQRLGVGLVGVTTTPSTGTNISMSAANASGTAAGGFYLPCYGVTSSNPEGNCSAEFVSGAAGLYTVTASSALGTVSNFGFQLSSEVSASLVADTPFNLATTRIGQYARLSFNATAGDTLGVSLAGIAATPRPQSFSMTVYRPDGSTAQTCNATPPAGAYCELGSVSATGTYVVKITAAYGAFGTSTLTVKQGPLLAPTDPPLAFSAAAASEVVRFRFSGTAGQNMAVAVSELANASGSGTTYVSVLRPTGTQFGVTGLCAPTSAAGSCKVSLINLPATGTYWVTLAPPVGVQISGKVTLTSEATGSLSPGVAQSLSFTRPGQNARFTFSGTLADSTSIKIMGIATTPTGLGINVTLFKPDGTSLSSTSATGGAAPIFINLPSLPATGTYSLFIEPTYGEPWSAQVVLDPGQLLSVDGATATVTNGAAGETIRYRFNGTAGQRVQLGIAGLTYSVTDSSVTSVTVYGASGSTIASTNCFPSLNGCDIEAASLPATGTYSIVISPPSARIVTAGTIALSSPLAGTFTIGNPAQGVAISRPGQTARYTFAGTAAQLLRLSWSGTSVSGGATVAVNVLKPDGTSLVTGSFGNASTNFVDLPSLPATGTYTIVLDPSYAASMSGSFALVTR